MSASSTTFSAGNYNANGTLHAISIVGGKVVEKWKVAPSATDAVNPNSQIAAGNFDGKPGNELVVCAGAAILLLPALVLFSSPPEPVLLSSSASTVFATLYLAAGVGSFIGLRHLGWKPVVLLLAIVWAGDSAAYYVGKNWGRRKLAPVVSPKKTWEGFWGQMAGGTAIGGAAAALVGGGSQVGAGAILGCSVSAIAVVGDLVESTFKRSCSVKDSGAILPGHGGLLDRLDSLLFAAPFLLLALRLLPEGFLR